MQRFLLLLCFITNVTACVAYGADAPLRAATTQRPNIIVILADDLGYGDVSCNGATRVQTPHIDRLAREGR